MKALRIFFHCLACVIIFMLVIPSGIMAQAYVETTGQPVKFKQEELAQMLAPIALYPDSLVAQILMASTYPIEVVEAERWLRTNQNLISDELDRALQEKPWDVSIKSLCHFPQVLYTMSEKLEQTTVLGDAFMVQQDAVMDTIQYLRARALEHGNLITTKEQTVIVEKEIIRIEPVYTQVIYVPVYDPLYVYGPWWYPAYPPYHWYRPNRRTFSNGIVGFSTGFIVGFGISSWNWCDWHHHHIYVDIHKIGRFHRFDKGKRDFDDRYAWRHKPLHRRVVVYRKDSVVKSSGRSVQHFSAASQKKYDTNVRDIYRRSHRTISDPVEKRTEKTKGGVARATIQRKVDRGKAVGKSVKVNSERRPGEQILPRRQKLKTSNN